MTMHTPEEIATLPRWARDYIAHLERGREDAEQNARLRANPAGDGRGPFSLEPYGDSLALDSSVQAIAYDYGHEYDRIHLQADPVGHLKVMSTHRGLIVRPVAANVVTIASDPRR